MSLKHRMTNKELARWLSLGKGQACISDMNYHCDTGLIIMAHQYAGATENMAVPQRLFIRPWGSKRWEEPYITNTELEGITT